MLRRKLVISLATLLALLLTTLVSAIWMLHGLLGQLHHLESSHSLSVHAEYISLVNRFQWIVLGLSIVFLIVINVSVVMLLRTAGMVLQPVERLIEGTRELAHENFSHRVSIEQNDEFGELAQAYNHMADQLQASERRKLETLGQVALTLNHELNNAMAIISLQLQLLSRHGGNGRDIEGYAKQIHESLARMASTVDSLKRVRRIVLTDYVGGEKMLDLQRSLGIEDDQAGQSRSTLCN